MLGWGVVMPLSLSHSVLVGDHMVLDSLAPLKMVVLWRWIMRNTSIPVAPSGLTRGRGRTLHGELLRRKAINILFGCDAYESQL